MEMNIRKYKTKIRGIRPIMVASPLKGLDKTATNAKKKQANMYNPDQQAEDFLYKNKKGEIYIPSSHIEGALIKAAGQFTIPGQKKKTYKDTCKAQIFVNSLEMPILDDRGNDIGKQYEVNTQITRNPSTGGRNLTSRPVWKDWCLEPEIHVLDPDQLSGDTLRDILEHAGRYQGIGTFRPKFGLFEVVEFEEIKEKKK